MTASEIAAVMRAIEAVLAKLDIIIERLPQTPDTKDVTR